MLSIHTHLNCQFSKWQKNLDEITVNLNRKMACTERASVRIKEIKVNLELDDIFNSRAIVSQEIIRTVEREEDKP